MYFLFSSENYTFYPRIILSLCKALLFASIASSTGPILCFRGAEIVVLQIFSTYYLDSRFFVLFFIYFGALKELLHFVNNVVMSLVGTYSLFQQHFTTSHRVNIKADIGWRFVNLRILGITFYLNTLIIFNKFL